MLHHRTAAPEPGAHGEVRPLGVVRRRLVIHVGGYDPVSPEVAHARFVRELRRFERTWGASASVSPPAVGADEAVWRIEASGPNWTARTIVRLVRWDDVMARDGRQPVWLRLPAGALALADFVVGGALWGYLRHAWRYGLFFLYPVILLLLPVGLGIVAGMAAASAGNSALLGIAAGLAAAAVLLVVARSRLSLDHLLDDWIFSRRYIRSGDPILGPRLDRASAELAAGIRGGEADEVVVIGHSLGAALAVDLLDRAIRRDPELCAGPARVALVTVGSSLPKLGLHRAATRLRDAIARVAAARGLFWVEYQSLTDAMNFYKTNPARLRGGRSEGPLIRTVRISRMLDPEYYKRIRGNFFRLHNQFVSGNDRRAPYDYFMLVCGPLTAEAQARTQDGPAAAIDPAGGLISQAAPA